MVKTSGENDVLKKPHVLRPRPNSRLFTTRGLRCWGRGPSSLFNGHEMFPNSLATDHNALLKDPRVEIEKNSLKG